MSPRSFRRFPRHLRGSKPGSRSAVRVLVGAQPRRRWRWLVFLLVAGSLGGGLVLLLLSFRLGLRLMLDPEAMPRLAQFQQTRSAKQAPTATLDDLRQQAVANQQRLGDPLFLGKPGRERTLVLVPVFATETRGQAATIASLTLFQAQEPEGDLRAIASLPVSPIPPEIVLAPWNNSAQAPTATPSAFSLSRVVPLPSAPVATQGTWLTLEGTWQQQGLTLRYGHLIYVDPQSQRLDLIEPWSSPVNHLPQWVDLDGDGPSDLIIDETLGLEPALRGLQVLPGSPPRVQSVSWLRVPVDAGAKTVDYRQALRSARSGLWHPAQAQLAQLKTALGWNPMAEAQLRLIKRHAAITRHQADQDWSTLTQQMLALIIDGRWEAALAILEANPDLVPAVVNRLGADQGRLWNRISAAAALPDPEPAVYVWGGLAIKAQQRQRPSRDGATSDWLDRQPVPAVARQRLATVLTALATAEAQPLARVKQAENTPTTVPTPDSGRPTIAIAPVAAFIGQARAISAPTGGYAAPGQSLDASLGQWYAIDLRARYQNQLWQRGTLTLPSNAAPEAVWSAVQSSTQPLPQLLHWVSPAAGLPSPLTVRGLKLTNGAPVLLATGPAVSESPLPPLAFSQGALMWPHADWRQRPEVSAIAAPIARAIFGNQPPPADFAESLAQIAQHSLDLTGNGQVERLLIWDEAAVGQLQIWGVRVEGSFPKTIILSADNQVLYNDIVAPQTLLAVTNPAKGLPVGLLVYRAGQYELLPWQATAQRFE